MYYQQGVNIEPRRFSYSCGAWRNRARTGSECTSHYIRKNVLLDLVLEDMRRVLQYVKEHEQDFICKATEYGDMEARKALAQQQKELSKAQARMTELDTLFRKLYEDNALGRLTDERFVFLTSGYEDEKKSLAARIDELQQQIATVTERKRDISRFIQIVGKYSDIQELTYENVHEFIDRILIRELDRETNTRKIEIHYSFVGQVDTEYSFPVILQILIQKFCLARLNTGCISIRFIQSGLWICPCKESSGCFSSGNHKYPQEPISKS